MPAETVFLSGINMWKFTLSENLACISEKSLRVVPLLKLPLMSGVLVFPSYCFGVTGPIHGHCSFVPYSPWKKAGYTLVASLYCLFLYQRFLPFVCSTYRPLNQREIVSKMGVSLPPVSLGFLIAFPGPIGTPYGLQVETTRTWQ